MFLELLFKIGAYILNSLPRLTVFLTINLWIFFRHLAKEAQPKYDLYFEYIAFL